MSSFFPRPVHVEPADLSRYGAPAETVGLVIAPPFTFAGLTLAQDRPIRVPGVFEWLNEQLAARRAGVCFWPFCGCVNRCAAEEKKK